MSIIKPEHKAIAGVLIGVIVFVAAVFAYMAILYYFPGVPARIDSITIDYVENGHMFQYTPKWEKLKPVRVDISRSFVGLKSTVILPAYVGNKPVGKYNHQVTFEIPRLPPDCYYYEWEGTFPMNPLQSTTIRETSNKNERFCVK
jgi:hypothetical protein